MNNRHLSFILLGNGLLAGGALLLALAGQVNETPSVQAVQLAPSTPQILRLEQVGGVQASEHNALNDHWNEQPRQPRWVF